MMPVAGAVWIVVALSVLFERSASLIAALCGMVAAVALVVAIRHPRSAVLSALLAIGMGLGAAGAAHVAIAQPVRERALELPTAGGRIAEVEALVVGKVERRAHGWSFDAVTSRISVGDESHRAPTAVVVRLSSADPAIDVGARVSFDATAAPADVGERAVLVLQVAGAPRIVERAAGVWHVASSLRRGLQQATEGLPQPAAGLIAGLAVGDTSAVTPELDADMKASALSHLTAVSGANCALVVGMAFGCAAAAGARRGVRVAVGLGALVAFVVLVTPEPSVARAAAMGAVAMVAVLLGRSGAGVAVLSTAVSVLLIADPWLSLTIGFALSATATGSLLLFAAPLAHGLARWMPAPLALTVAVPLAAQLACGPLLVLIEPTVPLLGVVANILAGPAAPVATVLGLLACLTSPIPPLAAGLAAATWVPAAWIAETATLAADQPGNAAPWFEGPIGLAALALAGWCVYVVVTRSSRSRLRTAALFALAATGGVLIAVGPVHDVVERARTPTGWAVAACDVGQGDALLLRSAERVALVDTGPDPDALSTCLARFGVTSIDLLVLTHFDLDHTGGIDAVTGRVESVLHGPADDASARMILNRLTSSGARLFSAHRGISGELGSATWRVLWPAGDAFAGNDASVVLDVRGGGIPATLLLGDLSAAPQMSVAPALTGPYEIVKVAHHGSADQFERLYDRAGARLALISVGENTYGHPRDEIIHALTRRGTTVARTDESGALAAWTGSDSRLRVWHQRGVGGPR